MTTNGYNFEGQNVSLNCYASGNPYPTTVWYSHGQQIEISCRIKTSGNQLNIFNSTTKDGVEYTCVSSNEVGKRFCKVNVIVRGLLY